MENRRNVVESLFQAAAAVEVQPTVVNQFEAVRNACDDATAAYLSASSSDSDATGRRPDSYDRSGAFDHAQQLLSAAGRGLDQFHERHRAALDAAVARGGAASAQADAALARADDIGRRMSQTDTALRAYPSVQRAGDQLITAYGELQEARDRRDLAAMGSYSLRLETAVQSVVDALDAAPKRDEQARHTMTSLRTRLDALRNRVDSVEDNRSALLREFHSNSSRDLLDNGPISRNHLTRADALLAQALEAQRARDPEKALELATRARSELTLAEQLIDAVADRLALLRELRKDPASKEKEVRFRLRDAQRLAVDRRVTKEWGSALDAQAARIDQIVQGLDAPHPDYWGYHRALEEISQSTATMVARIRKSAPR